MYYCSILWLCTFYRQFNFIQVAVYVMSFPFYFIGYVLAKDINNKHKVSIWKLMIVSLLGYIIFFMLNRSIGTHLSLFWLQGIFLTSVITLMLKFSIVPKFLSLLRRMGVYIFGVVCY